MLDHFRRRLLVLLQHLLHQVDAAARAVEFVAKQHVSRAGRGAEAAMHAGAQDLVSLGDIGIGELLRGEFSLHDAPSRAIRPRLSRCLGSNEDLMRPLSAATPSACG